jgi:hypothetical protein
VSAEWVDWGTKRLICNFHNCYPLSFHRNPPKGKKKSGKEEKVWSVEKILRAKLESDGTHEYLVKWKGYVAPTWEPIECIWDSPELSEWSHTRIATCALALSSQQLPV